MATPLVQVERGMVVRPVRLDISAMMAAVNLVNPQAIKKAQPAQRGARPLLVRVSYKRVWLFKGFFSSVAH